MDLVFIGMVKTALIFVFGRRRCGSSAGIDSPDFCLEDRNGRGFRVDGRN